MRYLFKFGAANLSASSTKRAISLRVFARVRTRPSWRRWRGQDRRPYQTDDGRHHDDELRFPLSLRLDSLKGAIAMKSTIKTLMLSLALLAAAAAQAAGGGHGGGGDSAAGGMGHVGGAATNANGGAKAADRDTGAPRAADRRAQPAKSEAAEN